MAVQHHLIDSKGRRKEVRHQYVTRMVGDPGKGEPQVAQLETDDDGTLCERRVSDHYVGGKLEYGAPSPKRIKYDRISRTSVTLGAKRRRVLMEPIAGERFQKMSRIE